MIFSFGLDINRRRPPRQTSDICGTMLAHRPIA
ncbi:unnamed protein product [Schistosoma curassoni]|uniref:Transposase n=1 Tax=Schistosoma curassoni TaxID=6186 RepID=A0A183KKZ8_9TREM|nr:unnamed protein product [Schistosoma curassoni]